MIGLNSEQTDISCDMCSTYHRKGWPAKTAYPIEQLWNEGGGLLIFALLTDFEWGPLVWNEFDKFSDDPGAARAKISNYFYLNYNIPQLSRIRQYSFCRMSVHKEKDIKANITAMKNHLKSNGNIEQAKQWTVSSLVDIANNKINNTALWPRIYSEKTGLV